MPRAFRAVQRGQFSLCLLEPARRGDGVTWEESGLSGEGHVCDHRAGSRVVPSVWPKLSVRHGWVAAAAVGHTVGVSGRSVPFRGSWASSRKQVSHSCCGPQQPLGVLSGKASWGEMHLRKAGVKESGGLFPGERSAFPVLMCG